MPKKRQIPQQKPKLPILVKIIAVLLILFALQILILVFVSLYMHFFGGYSIPENVNRAFAFDLIKYFVISLLLISVAIFLWKRKKIARILAIIALLLISILNLKAEIFNTDSPAIHILIIYSFFLLAALYLLFSMKVREAFN